MELLATATIAGYELNSSQISYTVTRNVFMEQVGTYTKYKIASYFSKYWFPILVPVGLIGNTLSFLVMIRPNNRKMSTCIYMAAISINDNLMMCSALHNWLATVAKIYEMYPIECKLASFFGLHVVQNSTFQVIAMTLDKYVAIKWPHKAATYSTPKKAKMTVIIIHICVVIFNLPHLYMSQLTDGICLGYSNGGTITKVYSWFTFVINAIIPLTSLIYMNGVIIQKVRSSRKQFGFGEDTQNHDPSNVATAKRQKTMKNTENQLTIMLLLVTTLFLILMIPTYIRFLYTTFVIRDSLPKYVSVVFFYHLSHKLYHTNNGINFFLYCISGQKFRNDLKEILSCNGESVPAIVLSRSTETSTVA